MKMLSGSVLIGNKEGISIAKKTYVEVIEINSTNKNNSIMFLEGVRIPIDDMTIIENAKIIGILLFFCI